MKKAIAAIILGIIIIEAYSQVDFRPAYIIDLKNDTVYGFINYNANVYYNCEFKKTPESEVINYKPFEIKSYRFIDDKYYISREVVLKNSYTRINLMDFPDPLSEGIILKSNYKEEGTYKDSVFLEYLVKGEMDLYYLKDLKGIEHYFIENTENNLLDLTIEKIQTFYNGTFKSEVTKNSYIGKIKAAMIQCPQVFEEIDNIELDHKNLIKVTSDYHNYMCTDQKCIVYQRKLPTHSVHFGVYSGLGISKSYNLFLGEFGSEDMMYFEPSFSPIIGFDIRFMKPHARFEKFSYKIKVQMLRASYNKDTYHYSYVSMTEKTVTINYSDYSLYTSFLGETNFSTNAKSPYAVYGILFKYSFAQKFDGKNLYELQKSEPYPYNCGFVLGLGYEIPVKDNHRKIFTELVYEQMINEYNVNFAVGFEF
jgi:hypothetical protein